MNTDKAGFIVDEGSSVPQIPAGTYQARCFRIVDIGTQHTQYEGEEQIRRQLVMSWELPTKIIEEGEWAGAARIDEFLQLTVEHQLRFFIMWLLIPKG